MSDLTMKVRGKHRVRLEKSPFE